MSTPTAGLPAAIKRSIEVAATIAEAIKDTREIPSGTLYALVMSHLSLSEYQSVIDMLVKVKLITNNGHLLRWVGEHS